jgi:CHAD domain-containing protein
VAKGLRRGESAAKLVRRIVRREVTKALETLAVHGPPADAAIHDARKRLKRARAALRLVREPLGSRRFRLENEALRDAARPLSEIRDAKILVEAFDALVERPAPRDALALRRIRDALVAHQVRVRGRVFRKEAPLEPVVEALRSARKRTDEWPLAGDGWSSWGSGLRRVYRSGRKALERARQKPRDVELHELRKQAKYLWQQLEILEPVAPAMIKPLAARAHRLSDDLGDDHDLAVLGLRLGRARAGVSGRARAKVSRMIEARRGKLKARGMAMGERVYGDAPGRFVKRLRARWRVWRSGRS